MKIIHCADLHLDSRLTTNLEGEKVNIRKAELLHTFERMVAYAKENGVEVILIAGDLFDKSKVSAITKNTVMGIIREHSAIHFYILRGNHDQKSTLFSEEELPTNLFLFGEEWSSYEEAEGRITITGIELTAENSEGIYRRLQLQREAFSIVMLHGQESESEEISVDKKERAEKIILKDLRGKGIDYLALGHIHLPKIAMLEGNVKYAYPGCLEGRGFDECGEHGFILLDIDLEKEVESKRCDVAFIPFAYRKLYTISADVSDCDSSIEIASRVRSCLQEEKIDSKDMVKVVLTGEWDVEGEKDMTYLQTVFAEEYFAVKVEDETHLKLDMDRFLKEESLKGEFVRKVYYDESISEEDRMKVIRLGLQVLAGEKI